MTTTNMSTGMRPLAYKSGKFVIFYFGSKECPTPDEKITRLLGAQKQAKQWDKQSFIESLSPCGKEIVNMVLKEPDDLIDVIDNKKKSRRCVIDRLREGGWSWPKIYTGIREVKKAINGR